MSTKIFGEDGELKEVQQNGETVVDIGELREQLSSVNGNPQVVAVLESIVDYLERES